MDLLNLGNQSRKTGIKPRKNLRKDKYDMEDVDDFFTDDEDDRSSHRRRTVTQVTPQDNFDNVARKINFTDAEAELFNLSPISMSSKWGVKKKNKKSPLRSPLPERGVGRARERSESREVNRTSRTGIRELKETSISNRRDSRESSDTGGSREPRALKESRILRDSGESMALRGSNDSSRDLDSELFVQGNSESSIPEIYMDMEEPNDEFDDSFNASNHDSFSPVSLSPLGKTQSSPDVPTTSRKSTSSLTKNMALGNTSSKKMNKKNYRSINDSSELLSPPPTTKKPRTKIIPVREQILRASPLPSPPPDGLRRSRRTKIAPLAFWRNERIVYTRALEENDADTTLANDIRKIPLQEIKEVVHIPEADRYVAPSTKKRKGKLIAPKAKKEVYDYESDPEINGSEWFNKKILSVEVSENNTKIKRQVAIAPGGVEFEELKDPNFPNDKLRIARLFTYNKDFTATAILELPFEGIKHVKSSEECVYTFHVVTGLIEVTLNKSKFVVTRGCSFEIPDHNTYGLKNLGQDVAKLFFVQCRAPVEFDDFDDEL